MPKFLLFFLTSLLLFTLIGCHIKKQIWPKQFVFLFKDSKGVFLYNPEFSSQKLLYKTNKTFLEKPFDLSNETLTFGCKGEVNSKELPNGLVRRNYTEYYVSIDLKSGINWISKKVFLQTLENYTFKITSTFYNSSEKVVKVKDTFVIPKTVSFSYKGINLNDTLPRFFSKSTVGSISVVTLGGSLYTIRSKDTSLLLKFNDHFDMKFGSGYFNPEIDPSGKFVVFNYLPGIQNTREKASLQKINIKTKSTNKIKDGEFWNPKFSSNGQFLLFNRYRVIEENGSEESLDFYILDLNTLKEKKIGLASSAAWKF